FWASLLPCDSAMNPAERTWSRRKIRLSRYGFRFRAIQSRASMIAKPMAKPTSGLTIRLSTTLTRPGTWIAPAPAWASAEPTKARISRAVLTGRWPSRVLDHDRQQSIAHIVAGVDRLLQALQELLVLDQSDGVGLGPEHRGELGAEDPVALALEAVQEPALVA